MICKGNDIITSCNPKMPGHFKESERETQSELYVTLKGMYFCIYNFWLVHMNLVQESFNISFKNMFK